MDWENERYVRLYVRETIDDAVLSWEARALWHELLKRLDRAGVLDVGEHGWKGVALLVRMPAAIAEQAGPELVADGRIELRGKWLIAPNYIAAQEAKQSDKMRQAESRARRRDIARAEDEVGIEVTKRDSESRNVTETAESVTAGHAASHDVTPCLAVASCAVPSRDLAAPAAKPRRKAKGTAAPEVPGLVEARDRFHELYLETNQAKPTWDGKQVAQLKRLVKAHGADEVMRRAEVMFRSPPPWPPPPHDLGTLVQHFDKFAKAHEGRKAGHYQHTGDEEYAGGEVEL